MRMLMLTGLILASVATGFVMGTSHSPSYAANPQYTILNLAPVTGCPNGQNLYKEGILLNIKGGPGLPAPTGQCLLVQRDLNLIGAGGWRLVTVVNGNAIFMQ